MDRYTINIYPESPQDVAYIEEVLGLEDNDDAILLKRFNAHGTYTLSRLSSVPDIITSAKRIEEIADAAAAEDGDDEPDNDNGCDVGSCVTPGEDDCVVLDLAYRLFKALDGLDLAVDIGKDNFALLEEARHNLNAILEVEEAEEGSV